LCVSIVREIKTNGRLIRIPLSLRKTQNRASSLPSRNAIAVTMANLLAFAMVNHAPPLDVGRDNR
jgi:hypothetical protein